MKRCVLLAVFSLACVTRAWSVPVMDGNASLADGYGTALSVQNTNTGYGNATTGDPVNGGGGSEIDQVFATVANGRLYVTVAGNLEWNFNKMQVFIDSKAGGVNNINGAALPKMVDGYCCTTGGGVNLPNPTDGALQRLNGLVFDSGFDADYYLTFSNGPETVNPGMPDQRQFWAVSAHYADLTNTTNGAVVAAGMQIAPHGLPNVLRYPGDYNRNGKVDGADYVVYRDTLGQTVAKGSGADANGDQTISTADYDIWRSKFGDGTTLADFPWVPFNPAGGSSDALIGPALPGLAQGQLIDRTYATTSGGCNPNDTGAGCAAGELELVLNVDPAEAGTNQSNHRNFNNSIGLELGFDNSNSVGVTGAGPYETPTTGNPQDVRTGIEFSIPLSQIGTTASGGPIKLTIFVGSNGHNNVSNQFSGDGILLGNAGNVPLSLELDEPGVQFVTVANSGVGAGGSLSAVPEPVSIMLVLTAGLAACGCIRRR